MQGRTESSASGDAPPENAAPAARAAPGKAHRISPAKIGFLKPSLGVVALWLALAAAQAAAIRVGTVGWDARTVVLMLAVTAFTGGVATVVTRWPQDSFRYLASTYASVVWIAALAIGTSLGTVVLQGADAATFAARYPNAGPALEVLGLADMFHSWPFRAVGLGLLVSSLATVIQRRKTIYRWRHIGLLTTHVSLLVIVVGGIWGSSMGSKGMLHLRVGQSSDTMMLSGGGHHNEPSQLPFAVKLEKFELTHHTPEFRLYTWQRSPDGRSKLVASQTPTVGEPAGQALPGGNVQTRVTRVFQRAVPVRTAAADAAATHLLVAPSGEQLPVTPGGTFAFKDGTQVAVEGFYADFFYDMQRREPASRSSQPNNPALSVRTRGADGAWSAPRFLFAREDLRGMTTGAHDAVAGLTYRFSRTQGQVVAWEESAAGPENPAVEIAVTAAGQTHTEMRFASDPKPLFLAPGRAVFFEEKSGAIRNYRSTLTVTQGNTVVASRVVEVNDPLYVGAYGLFQSNFDPKDPNYSGIQVVHDPGLNLAITGLWLLVLGILQALTLRNWEPWWERKRARARAGAGATNEVEAHA